MTTNGKAALITGANKGIGFATARALGQRGFTVYIGARDEARGQEAAQTLVNEGIDAHFLQIDVTDDASIAAAATTLSGERDALDVLVNNAGVAEPNSMPSQTTRAELRSVFEINVFGVVAVTNAFLPLLKAANSARIVNISSEVGSLSALLDNPESPMYQYLRELTYPVSKTAVNMITGQFAKELAGDGIKVSAAIPGYVATDLNGFTGDRTPEQAADVVVTLATLPDDAPTAQFWGSLTGAEPGEHSVSAW